MMNNSRVWAAAALAVMTLVCFWRLTLHPTDLLVGPQRNGQNDVTSQFLEFRAYAGRGLREDTSSLLWNSHAMAGAPWLGSPQAAVFYPPNWLFAFVPSEYLISWLMVFHHWFGGIGTFLLCRRYAFSRPAALLAAGCYLGAPFLVANTSEGHFPQVCLVAWFPWAFLMVERLRARQRGGVSGTAIILALAFFAGHVQELFYLILALTVYLIFDIFPWRRGARAAETKTSIGRPSTHPAPDAPHAACTMVRHVSIAVGTPSQIILSWCFVGVVLLGLVAAELIPMFAYSRNSVRAGGVAMDALRAASLQPRSLIQLLDPRVFGGPEAYSGPGTYYWDALCHFGIVPLIMALIGAAACRRWYPGMRLVVLWLAAFLFAFGDQTPWFPFLYRFVPGISLFRGPARALFFCSFFTAVMAGAGVEVMLVASRRARLGWRRLVVVAALVALILAAGLWWWQQASRGASAAEPSGGWPEAWRQLAVLRVLGWSLAGGGALFLMTMRGWTQRCGTVMVVLLCAGELAWHAGEVLRTIPQVSIRRDNPIVEAIRPKLGFGRILAPQHLVSDREAWRGRISKVQAYEPVPLGRFGLYCAAAAPGSDSAMAFAGFAPLNLERARKPLLDALGAQYVVVDGAGPSEASGWRRWHSGSVIQEFHLSDAEPSRLPYTIYENLTPMPRAYVLGATVLATDPQNLIAQLSQLDPRRTLLMERDILPDGVRQEFRPATIVEYTATRVVVHAQTQAPGYLVLSDAYFPGWSAIVDGSPAPVLPANIVFRAVPLTPGQHTIEFDYATPGARLGVVMSILTLLLVVLVAVRGWRRS